MEARDQCRLLLTHYHLSSKAALQTRSQVAHIRRAARLLPYSLHLQEHHSASVCSLSLPATLLPALLLPTRQHPQHNTFPPLPLYPARLHQLLNHRQNTKQPHYLHLPALQAYTHLTSSLCHNTKQQLQSSLPALQQACMHINSSSSSSQALHQTSQVLPGKHMQHLCSHSLGLHSTPRTCPSRTLLRKAVRVSSKAALHQAKASWDSHMQASWLTLYRQWIAT